MKSGLHMQCQDVPRYHGDGYNCNAPTCHPNARAFPLSTDPWREIAVQDESPDQMAKDHDDCTNEDQRHGLTGT